ncbi:hypothetical protein NBRC116583_31940 [Arenicella sp. 4NH20-0111]|uniref:RHS repeat domain-containing protein n=1 Tax=Arenicella sp. 4NH20-0111 TaxID=3127648 RepID=UPI003104DC3E
MMNIKSTLIAIGSLLVAAQLGSVQAKDIQGSASTSYGVSTGGAFQFSMPIVVPQGRKGITPNMALNFSSGQGAGALGVGWSVSGLSAITRCGKNIVTDGIRVGVQHNKNDRFCLNGQRLILVGGNHAANGSEYRTQLDGFSKIMAYGSGSSNIIGNGGTAPTRWKVWAKNGAIFEYGAPDGVSTHSAQFKLPGTTSIHTWNLARMLDRDGNYYEATYRANDGLVDKVNYTYVGSTPKQSIDFQYEANTNDPRYRYIVGSKIEYNDRLKKVVVTNLGQTYRTYTLTYETAPITGRSRVTRIKECGHDGSCMPDVEVDWLAKTEGYTNITSPVTGNNTIAPDDLIEYLTYDRRLGDGTTESGAVKEIRRGQWVDLNGDGELDMVISYVTPGGSVVSEAHMRVNGDWQQQSNWKLPRPLRSYEAGIVNTTQARFLPGVINMGQFSDVNGDGLVDVVYSYRLDTMPGQTGGNPISNAAFNVVEVKETYLNTGSGWGSAQTGSNAWAPKDLIFDYLTNGGDDFKRSETVRGSLIDLNGDGLPDWVTAYFEHTSNGNGIEHKTTWMNTGNGWAIDANYAMPDVFSQYRGVYNISRGQLVDINGDGLVDWMRSFHASQSTHQKAVWLNTGTGWDDQLASSPYILHEVIHDNINGWDDASPVTHGRFIDINGDGLSDWVSSYRRPDGAEEKYVRLNTGKGWAARNDGFSAPGFLHVNFNYSDFSRGWPVNNGGVFMDVNSDGLVDYIESYIGSPDNSPVIKKAWINTGDKWEEQPQNSVYTPQQLYYDYSEKGKAKPRYGQFVDVNSDGAADWVGSRKSIARNTRLKTSPRRDELDSITTNQGVTIKPVFKPLTADSVIYKQYPEDDNGDRIVPVAGGRFIRRPMYVTSEVRTPTVVSGTDSITTYQYEGAQFSRHRGFLGFRGRYTANNLNGLESYSEYDQRFPYIGMMRKSATMHDGDTISSAATNVSNKLVTWDNGNKTYHSYVYSTVSQQKELAANRGGGNGVISNSRVDTTMGDYGNVTKQTSWVYSASNATLHRTDTTYTYKNKDFPNWHIGQVSLVTQKNDSTGTSALTTQTAYDYETGYKGRLTKVTSEPNSSDASLSMVTEYGYDAYGNVEEEKSYPRLNTGDERINSIGYDNLGRLPVSVTNAALHQSTIGYDPVCDQPNSVTDENGLVNTVTYDGFCRVESGKSPLSLISTIEYARTGFESCTGCQSPASFQVTTTSPGEPAVVQTYNRFNQLMQGRTLGVDGRVIRQLTEYDALGRAVASTQPFYDGETQHWTETEYDDLGRVTQVLLPYNKANDSAGNGQRATMSYDYGLDAAGQMVRQATDTQGRVRTTVVNPLGQVEQVIDAASKILNYDYTSHGNLRRTEDSHGNEITLSYDLLGRRTVLNDPDLGSSTYAFTAWGELASQTDAKGNVINMTYDELSRIKTRTVPGTAAQSGGLSTWTYDNATWAGPGYLKGAVSSVTGPNNYARSFNYDHYGRPISEQTTIKGIQFNERYGYNNLGQLSERFYPNSGGSNEFGVQYSYENGYLTSILSAEDAQGQCIEHWRADDYDALGRVKKETLGKLVVTDKVFRPGQNVLESIASVTVPSAGSQTVQNLTYKYDSMNNVMERKDVKLSITESFQYDVLDRLKTHTLNSIPGSSITPTVVSVTYDDIGNIKTKSDVGTYVYQQNGSSKNSHRLLGVTVNAGAASLAQFQVNWEFDSQSLVRSLPSAGTMTYVYDANGSVTQTGNREINWTAFDKPERMLAEVGTDGAKRGSLYEYGPEQQRVFKQEAEFSALSMVTQYFDSTIYIGKDYERIEDKNGAVTHRYTIATGGHAIQIERADNTAKDTPKYLLADNLGSTHVILDAMGNIEQTLKFDPWGMRLNVGGSLAVNSITNRGYTGHEMDDETGLINMNARVYDPLIGRFLSADPVLQAPYNMASFNRYSYVWNNPMKFVDPSGNIVERQTPCLGASQGAGCEGPGSGVGEIPRLPDPILFGSDDSEFVSADYGDFTHYGGFSFQDTFVYNSDRNNDFSRNSSSTRSAGLSHSDFIMQGIYDAISGGPTSIWDRIGVPWTRYNNALRTLERIQNSCKDKCNFGYITEEETEVIGQVATAASGAAAMGPLSLAASRANSAAQTARNVSRTSADDATKGADNIADAARLNRDLVLDEVVDHAFVKHVLQQGEFAGLGIRTTAQFRRHVDNVLSNPSSIRYYRDGRAAYLQESTRTVVIRNPTGSGQSTAFQPRDWNNYINNVLPARTTPFQ